jgi:hypothetical protein
MIGEDCFLLYEFLAENCPRKCFHQSHIMRRKIELKAKNAQSANDFTGVACAAQKARHDQAIGVH